MRPGLLSPIERRVRAAHNKGIVMGFLSTETFSTAAILRDALALKSRQGVYNVLANLEAEGLVRRQSIQRGDGSSVALWGITHHGVAYTSTYVDGRLLVPRAFEPARVAVPLLTHTLELQRMQLSARAAGWSGWLNCDKLEMWQGKLRRPDAIAQSPNSVTVAIEFERTFKSIKRYEQILADYLVALKQGRFGHVVWVTPTRDMAQRLRQIITSFTAVSVAGQRVAVVPERHHAPLYFCDIATWPHYSQREFYANPEDRRLTQKQSPFGPHSA